MKLENPISLVKSRKINFFFAFQLHFPNYESAIDKIGAGYF